MVGGFRMTGSKAHIGYFPEAAAFPCFVTDSVSPGSPVETGGGLDVRGAEAAFGTFGRERYHREREIRYPYFIGFVQSFECRKGMQSSKKARFLAEGLDQVYFRISYYSRNRCSSYTDG